MEIKTKRQEVLLIEAINNIFIGRDLTCLEQRNSDEPNVYHSQYIVGVKVTPEGGIQITDAEGYKCISNTWFIDPIRNRLIAQNIGKWGLLRTSTWVITDIDIDNSISQQLKELCTAIRRSE